MEPAGDLADRAYLARTHRLCRSGIRELQEARAHGGKARRLMLAYIVRRVLYAIPILIGVNLLTFLLFFVVNTPDDMARMQLGTRRVTTEAIEKWKAEQGYDKPMLFNARAAGLGKLTDTIFYEKSVRLFAFDFGAADDGRSIANEIRMRMWPSLALALPVLLVGLAVNITFALLMAFFRATYLDLTRGVLCGARMSS